MTEIHGFTLLEERNIPEINSYAKLYKHVKTGAELLSLENDDENKSFMVALPTPPTDDTGLPHILEHSVLSGSRKYPVKDPFVQLLKTSVNTFLNAMTSSDVTYYPVASTNLQDFYNLVDVYLDAVFHPLITRETLMQEGWHLETEAEDAPLTYKGVVFNEMKAAYSTPEYYLNLIVDRAFWKDTNYRFSSGGLAAAIPDLTYEDFKTFHETYYHPSNARFVFSGDDDPETRLKLVNEVISEFEAKAIDSVIPLQKPYSAPVKIVDRYDGNADEENGGVMVRVDWLLPEQNDLETMMELSVLSHALVASSAAPLRKALIDSGLGEGMIGGGMGTASRQATFSAGLKGVKEDNADKVETLILETLGNLAEEGIDEDTVKASINTIEFNLRERNYGSFPRGLVNGLMAVRPWIYGGNPIDKLAFEADFEAFKQRIKEDDELLEQLIGKYLLDNSHRTTVILKPDEAVGKERDQAEVDRLAKIKSEMDVNAIQKVIETQAELLNLQQSPDSLEDLAKIPVLSLDDIDREITTVEQDISEHNGATIYFHNQPTGGIVYYQMGMNLRVLDPELLPYVDLFGDALTRLGTESEDFVKLTQRIGMKTGGIGADTSLSTKRTGEDYFAYLMLSGKVMQDQSQDLLDIVKDVLLTVKLDNQERFKQIVLERKASLERYIVMAGHVVAGRRVNAQFTEPAWATEQMTGTAHLFFIRELVDRIDNDWASVLASLQAIRDALVNRAQMVVNVTMEASGWDGFKSQLHNLLDALPSHDASIANWRTDDNRLYEALTLPAQANFNALAADLYQHGYEQDGSISVIGKHIAREYIWQNVRVMGGAYGGTFSFSPGTGLVTFYSWRDPNIANTQKVFTETGNYLKSLQMTDDDVEKAIIGAIGDMDGYDLPDAKGRKAFMRHMMGYTDQMRQEFRDQVLDTTLEDFHKLGDYLAKIGEDKRVAVVGSPEATQAGLEEMGVEFTTTKLK